MVCIRAVLSFLVLLSFVSVVSTIKKVFVEVPSNTVDGSEIVVTKREQKFNRSHETKTEIMISSSATLMHTCLKIQFQGIYVEHNISAQTILVTLFYTRHLVGKSER